MEILYQFIEFDPTDIDGTATGIPLRPSCPEQLRNTVRELRQWIARLRAGELECKKQAYQDWVRARPVQELKGNVDGADQATDAGLGSDAKRSRVHE